MRMSDNCTITCSLELAIRAQSSRYAIMQMLFPGEGERGEGDNTASTHFVKVQGTIDPPYGTTRYSYAMSSKANLRNCQWSGSSETLWGRSAAFQRTWRRTRYLFAMFYLAYVASISLGTRNTIY